MRKRGLMWAGTAAAVLLGTMVTGCQKQAPAPATEAAQSAWPKLVDEWVESDMKANPNAATYLGRHEYDGLFPDWSEAGLRNEIQRLKDFRARAAAVDATTLDAAAKFERDYLDAVIDGRLFWLETADWPHKNPTFYGFDPTVYLDRPYGDLSRRIKDYSRWASNLPAAAAQVKVNLKGPLPKAFIDIGMHTFGPLSDFLKNDVVKVFAEVQDPALRAEFDKQNAAAAAALADLQKHLESLRATQTDAFAMGPELFAKMVYANERVDTPLAELEQIGPVGHEAQPGRAEGSLREVRARQDDQAVHRQGCRQQAGEQRHGGPGAPAAGGPQALHRREGHRDDPRHRGSEGQAVAAVQLAELRLYRSLAAVRARHAGVLQRRRAGSRHGRRPSSSTTCRASRTCCSRRCTRSGPVTSCSSCIPTA